MSGFSAHEREAIGRFFLLPADAGIEELMARFRLVASISPNGTILENALAVIINAFIRSARYPEAVSHTRRLFHLKPSSSRVRVDFALELTRIGMVREAVSIAKSTQIYAHEKDYILESISRCLMLSPAVEDLKLLSSIHHRQDMPYQDLLSIVADLNSNQQASAREKYNYWSMKYTYSTPPVETYYMKKLLDEAGDLPRRSYDSSGRPTLSLSSIAHYGRFSHTVGNYLSSRVYADTHGFILETPEWPGHYFFDLNDCHVDQDAERVYITDTSVIDGFFRGDGGAAPALVPGKRYDLFSPYTHIFQKRFEKDVRAMLPIRKHWENRFQPMIGRIRMMGTTLVSIHIRLGDMEDHPGYGAINYACYVEWLERMWPSLDRPVLYVASDDSARAKEIFRKFSPISIGDIDEELPIVSYLQDFYVMIHSDVTLLTRGTFGLLPAALNRVGGRVYKQNSGKTGLMAFDPWTHPVDRDFYGPMSTDFQG